MIQVHCAVLEKFWLSVLNVQLFIYTYIFRQLSVGYFLLLTFFLKTQEVEKSFFFLV